MNNQLIFVQQNSNNHRTRLMVNFNQRSTSLQCTIFSSQCLIDWLIDLFISPTKADVTYQILYLLRRVPWSGRPLHGTKYFYTPWLLLCKQRPNEITGLFTCTHFKHIKHVNIDSASVFSIRYLNSHYYTHEACMLNRSSQFSVA